MILPYVYKLTHQETGEFYIGYRCKNEVPSYEDLGRYYFSSSDKVKPKFEEYQPEVIAEFFDDKEAYWFEQELIKENWNDPKILNRRYHNRAINSGIFRRVGPRSNEAIEKYKKTMEIKRESGWKLPPRTPEHIQKISETSKGRIPSKETIEKRKLSNAGFKHSEESKIKMRVPKTAEHNLKNSLAQKGKKLIEQHKEALRRPKKINRITCEYCNKELMPQHFIRHINTIHHINNLIV